MTTPIAFLCRLTRRAALAVGLLLLVSVFIGGAHHHSDGTHSACVVCAASHSPAISTALPSPVTVPSDRPRSVVLPVLESVRELRLETAPSRAPPLA
jgi:hypothetical protein